MYGKHARPNLKNFRNWSAARYPFSKIPKRCYTVLHTPPYYPGFTVLSLCCNGFPASFTLLQWFSCFFTLSQWFSCFFHSVAMVFLLLSLCHNSIPAFFTLSQWFSCFFHSVTMVFLLFSLCRNGFPASFTLSQWFSCFFHSVAMVFMLLSLCHNGFSCCLLYTTVYLNTNKCHIQSSAMHFVCIEVPAEWGFWLLSFLLIKKIW